MKAMRSIIVVVAIYLAGFTAQVTLREMWLPVRQRRSRGEKLLPAIVEGELKQGRRRFGGYVVHAGAILVVTAIAVSSTMSRSRELLLDKNGSATFGRYGLTFLGTDEVREPQRTSLVARIAVTRDGEDIGVLAPRMSQYESQREPVGSPAVRSFLFEDLYLSIMNLDAGGGKLGLHVFVNPMVGWIWPATMVMALGGLLALLPPTRRRVVVHGEAVASSPALGLPSESR